MYSHDSGDQWFLAPDNRTRKGTKGERRRGKARRGGIKNHPLSDFVCLTPEDRISKKASTYFEVGTITSFQSSLNKSTV